MDDRPATPLRRRDLIRLGGLVLANNFLLLVAFWEGVGLCSYLLIGYYFDKPSAADAARKAFLVTRLGYTGFLLGIFMLWKMGGWNTDLNLLFDYIQTHRPPDGEMTLACLLLFCGAVRAEGRSYCDEHHRLAHRRGA